MLSRTQVLGTVAMAALVQTSAFAGTIRIGVIAPLSGPYAQAGASWKAAFAVYQKLNGDPATGDKVELLPAVWHPHLAHPLAFLENAALMPWMGMLLPSASLGAVLAVLNQTMHGEKAQRLLVWLWRRRVLELVG